MDIGNGCDKAVPAARNCLDIERVVGGVTQRQSYLLNGGVQAVIEFHISAGRPNAVTHFFSANRLSGTFQEQRKYLKRLILQTNSTAVLGENALLQVSFKRAEADKSLPRRSSIDHCHSPAPSPGQGPILPRILYRENAKSCVSIVLSVQ